MRSRFIEDHRRSWPVRLMCQVFEVTPGGYYGWRGRPASAPARASEALVGAIKEVHGEAKARHGSPRIHAELVARGKPCCVNTVARLMREHGIAAKTKRKFRCTTDSNHGRPVAENVLDRGFEPEAADRAWTADITYWTSPRVASAGLTVIRHARTRSVTCSPTPNADGPGCRRPR